MKATPTYIVMVSSYLIFQAADLIFVSNSLLILSDLHASSLLPRRVCQCAFTIKESNALQTLSTSSWPICPSRRQQQRYVSSFEANCPIKRITLLQVFGKFKSPRLFVPNRRLTSNYCHVHRNSRALVLLINFYEPQSFEGSCSCRLLLFSCILLSL